MKRSELFISASLVPVDYLMVVLAGLTAYFFRYWQPVQEIRPVIFDLPFEPYFQLLLAIALLWPVSFWLGGLYSMKVVHRTVDEMAKIILGCSTAIMALTFIFFFSRSLFDSRFIIVAGWVLTIAFIIAGRGIIRFLQRSFYRFGIGVHRVILIGDGQLTADALASFKNDIKSGYRVEKTFKTFDASAEKQMTQMAEADKFDEIIIATGNLTQEMTERLNNFSYINHIDLKYIATIFDFPVHNFEINNISGLPIVEVKKTRLDGWSKIYKRIFDIVFSTVLIIVLSPVMLLIAITVKLDSRGPVFFVYKRIGELGRPFHYFKFRSMVKDAHKYRFDEKFLAKQKNVRQGTPMLKFKDDPRITRVGRFIRRYSLDELSELFNVFIGKMSLVGPRPHEIEEVARYKTEHKKVLTIKPGMTGMAQVSGRSDLDFDEEVKFDVWYMENWSLKLDIMILLKTPWAVLRRRQAE